MVSVAILGASGYVGGELLRLLIGHPEVENIQASSDTFRGEPIGNVHPNLRHSSDLAFVARDKVQPCDIVFLAMPHGSASANTAIWKELAPVVVDLSADFRLTDTALYEAYYGHAHPAPELLDQFTPGIPEFFRSALSSANLIAGPGCTALAAILALKPLRQADIVADRVFVDSKVGSSGSGIKPTPSTHHPTRAAGARVFKPSGHRHEAEVSAICDARAYVSVSSIDLIRGILVSVYCDLNKPVSDLELRNVYRQSYGAEPFTRLVKRKGDGPYTLPEPKLLAGTNYCDIGFATTRDGSALVAFAALDNLTKGAAGNAVHCMNIRLGFDETSGLKAFSPHPA